MKFAGLVFALSALALGCSADPDMTGEPLPDDCEPITCEQGGPVCGFAPDNCGGTIDCGDCGGADCTPPSCADIGAGCGSFDDGCGGTLECGTCDSGECSDVGLCVSATECSEASQNDCGGCVALAAPLGTACGCGSPVGCAGENSVQCLDDEGGEFENPVDATLFSFGGLNTGVSSAHKTLPDTDDAYDEWTEINGNLEASPQGPDIDRYITFVDDTFWGFLNAEFTFDSGGAPMTICVRRNTEDGFPGSSHCGDENFSFGNSCCKSTDASTPQIEFEVDILWDIPTVTDEDGYWSIRIYDDSEGEGQSCAPYTVGYRY